MGYEPKTKITEVKPKDFVNSLNDEQRKKDALVLLDMFEKVTKEKPKMWGTAIVGYGTYDYETKSGCAGAWMRTGFSPRKAGMSVYVMPGYNFDEFQPLLDKLGKYKIGRSCITFTKLENIDVKVLEEIVKKGYKIMAQKYP